MLLHYRKTVNLFQYRYFFSYFHNERCTSLIVFVISWLSINIYQKLKRKRSQLHDKIMYETELMVGIQYFRTRLKNELHKRTYTLTKGIIAEYIKNDIYFFILKCIYGSKRWVWKVKQKQLDNQPAKAIF